jgi:cytochrome P450
MIVSADRTAIPMLAEAKIDIYDADRYVAGPPHEAFTELRRTSPVFWQERPNGSGYWAILKHADVREISRQPELYSCWEKGVQIDTLPPEKLAVSRGMLTNMDPPLHPLFREPLMASFTPRKMAQLEDRVREITRSILVRARALMETGSEVEFVNEVCSPLPTQVFGELAGLPPEAWAPLHDMVTMLTQCQDPEIVRSDDVKNSAGADMLRYAIAFGNERRGQASRDDLTSALLDTEFAGRRLSEFEFGTHFLQFIVAGNETTVTLLSSGLQVLLDHPDQLAQLRADPSLLPGAIEEILRFANPLHFLGRTARVDVELRGKTIRAGDTVAMYYTSANRDEEAFTDPQSFDIHRTRNAHVTFGYANHFCMGAHLARLEARVFFEELFKAFPRIEAAGRPQRLRSNFNNALKKFPVALHQD